MCEMRADLSWPGDRTRPQIGPSGGGQEPLVVNVGFKRRGRRPRQIGFVKTNESEPLMTDRSKFKRCQNHGLRWVHGISLGAGLYAADAASGLKVASARIGLTYGTSEPVAPMPRETLKRPTRKSQSTEAGHRDGTARSSDEAPVMGVERRGRVIVFPANRSIPACREMNP